MTSAAKRRIGIAAALFAGAILMQEGFAQAPPSGVFSEVQTAVVPRQTSALEPATMRSRVVQVDPQKITAARRGREVLKLNLFDDAVVEVQIKRVRPTSSGYFISGTPRGEEWGEVRLVVNGPVMVGTVMTPEGKFTIRSAGSGRHVIRQVDPSAEPFECEVLDPPPLPPGPAISSIDPPPSFPQPPAPLVDDMPTEDGSEVRILVVYTPALQASQGGAAGMRALVDLMVQSANQAFEDGGISPRLVLAHAALVDYVAQRTRTDVRRLANRGDGYMDEVHALRNEHAADLVHLLTNVAIGSVGSAVRMTRESLRSQSGGFAATATTSEQSFTHEVGHNFGLRHDRYVDSTSSALYPYAFGYINLRAFEPDSPRSARWRTVMSYGRGCSDAGFGCSRLLRFSNPDQTYLGDAMGVAADDPATGSAGPADARLTINTSAPWVGSFRSQACTDFGVSATTQIAPLDGGEIGISVYAGPGCLWEATSQSEFLKIISDVPGAGHGSVKIEIEANRTGAERSGTLTLAGKTITVRQLATTQGICGRTAVVMNAIARAAGFSGASQCNQVTDDHLARVTRLINLNEISVLKEGDFEGLTSLSLLSLEGNELTDLPEGLFAGLASLTSLTVGYNELTELPAGLFAGLTRLESLRLSSNNLRELPAGIFDGLSNLQNLELDYNDLIGLAAGVFADLTSLDELLLNSNELAEYPAGLFTGLSRLEILNLNLNRATELPAGLFTGLSNLEELGLFSNFIAELPAGTFAGLSNLKKLHLGQGQFGTLPAEVFAGLSSLETLNFWDGQLSNLPAGLFSGLSNLQELNFYSNHLLSLPAGLFSGLSALQRLNLGSNQITSLPPGIFSGLTALEELNLFRNQLSSLPEGVFLGLTALAKLYLRSNRVDPIPLNVSLEKVGASQFKATLSAGAPFALDLPVSVGSAGEIAGNADSVTIPAGETQSAALGVARVTGTQNPVDVGFGTLPSPPASHTGYSLTKDPTLPRRILDSSLAADATLINLSISEGTLDPVFDKHSTSYTAKVAHAASSVAITLTKSNADASVAYFDSSDQTLADADAMSDGHQVNLDVGSNTIQIKVTAPDATTVRTYTLDITRYGASDVCGRTPQVREAIISASGVAECADVTNSHLSAITRLSLSRAGVASLQSGDFAGLNALVSLDLWDNEVSSLPGDIFSDLVALEDLQLGRNNLSRLPVEVFSSLKALIHLGLPDNRLVGLQRGHFAGLESLRRLNLSENYLASLPADIFSDLPGLEYLSLSHNRFRRLPPQLFSGLSALKQLYLHENRISALSADDFSVLSELETLFLYRNQLSSLPDGMYSGLTKLQSLDLSANKFDPFPLPLALETVGQSQFKLVAPTGAPFALSIPVTVSSAGEIEGGATIASIPIGSVESASWTVTRVTGSTDAITADFDPIVELPPRHKGYSFQRDDLLPKDIVPSTAPTQDAALRLLSVSPGPLSPSFDSGTTSYSVAVPNAVSSLTLTPTTSSANATVSFLDASDSTVSDADAATDGFQVNLGPGENTLKVLVTAEDTTTTRTYTLVVNRNRAPVITTTSPVSVEENVTEVAALTATDADGDEIGWLTNGGADGWHFDLTTDGVLTFKSAPDYERPDDLDEDNEYVVVAEASDGLDVSYLTLTVTVTDGDDAVSASDDASLSALGLSDGTLSPAFVSDTTNYTARVGANVSSMTVTPTKGEANATLAYLDGGDAELEDADGITAGHQVDLSVGENTVKVKVTAEDTTTMRTYTIVVARNRLPEITTSSPVSVEENQTAVATLAATDADGDDIRWSTNGGADENKFDLTAEGVLTFASAPDYEAPSDADTDNEYVVVVRARDGTDSTELTLTVKVTDTDDAPSDDAALSDLSLSVGTLGPAFAPGVTGYTATVANGVSLITVTPTTSDSNAAVAYLDGGDAELPDADDNAAGQQVDLSVGENTVKVRVTAEDTTTTRTYAIVVTRQVATDVCERTEQIRDAIVAAVEDVDACKDVTREQLSAITGLDVSGESLSSLQSGDLDGMTGLELLKLNDNSLSSLQSDIFSALTALATLELEGNRLSSLPSNLFSDLAHLKVLLLGGNRLSALPSDVFSGVSNLQRLQLEDNRLTDLPASVFFGLSSLLDLDLSGNSVDPLPLSVSLEKVGSSEVKAIALTGAPFGLDLPVSASSAGEMTGGANSVTIPSGKGESAPLGVTRVSGTKAAVTVDIGTLPGVPARHSGYSLTKGNNLPIEILPAVLSDDADLSGLSLSVGTLDPVFASGVASYAATVANGVSLITVTPTRSDAAATLAYLDGGDAELADADDNTAGHQVDLSVGENTVKVKVTAEDATTTRTYTIVVTRNQVPEITTSSPVFVAENETAVATLAATDGDDISWSTNGGADEDKFDLTVDGVLAFASAPDYEAPSDADANNEYVLIVRAADGTDTADLTLTVKVTDVDDSLSNDTRLSGLLLSVGTLDPAFASGVTSYAATVANGVSSITVTPTRSDAAATLAYLDGGDAELADADGITAGHQVDLSVGENTVKVRVTAEDTTTMRTYTVVVTRNSATSAVEGICGRTKQVRDAIVAAISSVDACEDVTATHLSELGSLDLSNENISSLDSDDFDGLTSLSELNLDSNQISDLPSDIFSGLTSLTSLKLRINKLTTLPSDLFSGLTALELIHLGFNDLAAVPSDLFSGLTSLTEIELAGNELTTLPTDLFSGNTALQRLWLQSNQLSSLPSDIFSGLTSLRTIILSINELTSLPSDIFSGLSSLYSLSLEVNDLEALPAGIFSGLPRLTQIHLSRNQLEALPDGIFSGLIAANRTGLTNLDLEDNPGAPFSISISLEEVGTSQFKVVIPKGAPFTMEVPVSAGSGGGIEDDADAVSMVGGSTESEPVGVTRVTGTTTAVTVDIGTLPDLPGNHKGYVLEKDSSLPLTITSPTESTPTGYDASYADVNRNGTIEADDAMLMYHAFESASQLGDGETGGTSRSRQILLAGLASAPDPTDDELREMLGKANQWREVGVEVGGDINGDGVIDSDDALAMYYAFEFENLVGDGEAGGAARFRRSLLAAFATQANPTDENLKAMLRRANKLREDFG